MKLHKLKCWPTYFDAVKRGEKPFEVRKNDRDFQVGDTVMLCRLQRDSVSASYDRSEPPLHFKIGYIMHGGEFGIDNTHCVMSLIAPPKGKKS